MTSLVSPSVIETWVQKNIPVYYKENKVKSNYKWQLIIALSTGNTIRNGGDRGKLESTCSLWEASYYSCRNIGLLLAEVLCFQIFKFQISKNARYFLGKFLSLKH